jgi:hypothetical protein
MGDDPGGRPGGTSGTVNAVTPVITAQPQGAVYTPGDTAAALSISASSPDGGGLSYQWYKSDNGTDWIAIPGASSTGCTPSIDAVGTIRYRVQVTNTIADNGDGGTKSATVTSNAVKVSYFDPSSLSSLELSFDNPFFGIDEPVSGWTLIANGDIDISLHPDVSMSDFTCDFSSAGTGKSVSVTLSGMNGANTASTSVTVRTLAKRIEAAPAGTAAAPAASTITLYANESFAGISPVDIPAAKAITLAGEGGERILTTGYGNMFRVAGRLTLDSNVTLQGITDNSASLVYVSSSSASLTMKAGAVIRGNTNTGIYGGGVYVRSGSFTMSGGEISGNTVSNTSGVGGGVHVAGGSFTMSGGEISGNTATGSGGGVYLSSSDFTMSGNAIIRNNTSGSGGGVYVYLAGDFTMSGNAIIKDNTSGSGVYVSGSNSTFIMTGGEISGNTDPFGGVSVWSRGAFTMSGGKISGNTSHGVYISGFGSTFIMSGGEVSDNTATYGGGVFVRDYGAFTMSGSAVISGNTASYSGGGVFVLDNAKFNKTGGTIYGDTDSTHMAGDSENTVTDYTYGHAVFYGNYGNIDGYYRNATLTAGDIPNTATDALPANSGDTLGYWTKK